MLKFAEEVGKVFRKQSVNIDNRTFFLNRVVTLAILTFCFLIQVGNTFFKTPIECMGEKSMPESFSNLYCYVHATYSINRPDVTLMHHLNIGMGGMKDEVRHNYYQWVTLALIAMAALTYFPTFLWRSWEGGRIKSLVVGLHTPCLSPDTREASKRLIKQFVMKGAHHQRAYLFRFMLCDLLNLAVVVGQLYFINYLVGNIFTLFGFDIIKLLGANPMERSDSMAFVFPTVAKCLIPKFGPSGRQETRDFICVLPFNLINEKMFIFLWVWFSVLAVLTIVGVMLRIMLLFSKSLRVIFLLFNCHPGHEKSVSKVVSAFEVSDWFVLRQIGKNLNTALFTEIVDELALELKKTCLENNQQLVV